MSIKLKHFRAFVTMSVLMALVFCIPAEAQTPYYIRASGGVNGGVDFHIGTSLSGTDNLYTWSDLVTPNEHSGWPSYFLTRLNYTIHIQYCWYVGNFGQQRYFQSGNYVAHQVAGGEENQFDYNETHANVENHVTANPTAWAGVDVTNQYGQPYITGIKYYYEYFASMQDALEHGICTWPSNTNFSIVVTYGETPPGGWAY
ncbi:MAG: hypothetical protein JWN14_1492 [Chthonomonadales bacterium]|nr:hypothetical protein [Chthonomonadales bacterium]